MLLLVFVIQDEHGERQVVSRCMWSVVMTTGVAFVGGADDDAVVAVVVDDDDAVDAGVAVAVDDNAAVGNGKIISSPCVTPFCTVASPLLSFVSGNNSVPYNWCCCMY